MAVNCVNYVNEIDVINGCPLPRFVLSDWSIRKKTVHANDPAVMRTIRRSCERSGGHANDRAVMRTIWRSCERSGGHANDLAVMRTIRRSCERSGGAYEQSADPPNKWA